MTPGVSALALPSEWVALPSRYGRSTNRREGAPGQAQHLARQVEHEALREDNEAAVFGDQAMAMVALSRAPSDSILGYA